MQVLLLVLALRTVWRLSDRTIADNSRIPVAVSLSQYFLLSVIPFAERLALLAHGSATVAHYNYAQRSVQTGQQLLVGGIVQSSFADWSAEGGAVREAVRS